MKKRIIALLSAILSVALIVGCEAEKGSDLIYRGTSDDYGDTGGLNLPFSSQNKQINILTQSEYKDLEDKIVIKELSKRCGLNISIETYSSSVITNEIRTKINSGNMPDIVSAPLSLSEINSLGEQDKLAAINKYMSDLPNFLRVFVKDEYNKRVFDDFASENGNLYVFPGYELEREADRGIIYRKDIFDENKINPWKNTEEFYQALKKLKEIYPDSIPFVTRNGRHLLDDFSASFGIDFPNMFFDRRDNTWKYSVTDIRFLEMLNFIRTLYQEELIDQDFLTLSNLGWEGRMKSSKTSFVTLDNIRYMDVFSESQKSVVNGYDLQYGIPAGPTGQIKSKRNIEAGPIVANNDNKIISLKLLDYLLSPSGISLMSLGMENKTFSYDNDGKDITYLGFLRGETVSKNALLEKYGLFVNGLCLSINPQSPCQKYSKREKAAYEYAVNNDKIMKESPSIKLKSDDKKKAEAIIGNITYKAYEFATEYIISKNIEPDAFEKWLEKVRSLGGDELIDIYNNRSW